MRLQYIAGKCGGEKAVDEGKGIKGVGRNYCKEKERKGGGEMDRN